MINIKTALALLSVTSLFLAPHADARRIQKETFTPKVLPKFISRISETFHNILPKSPVVNLYPRSMDSRKIAMQYLSEPSTEDAVVIARNYVQSSLGINQDSYEIVDKYTSEHNGVTHVYLKQVVNGLEVENGDININIDKQGRVLSVGDSFYRGTAPRPSSEEKQSEQNQFVLGDSNDGIGAAEAVKILAKYLEQPIPDEQHIAVENVVSLDGTSQQSTVLGFSFTVTNGIPVKQKYLQVVPENGDAPYLELVWDIQCEMEDNWYHAHVSVSKGQVVALNDWVSELSSYNVYPIGVNDPSDGERKLVVDPADKKASPLGWHAMSDKEKYTSTMGNNVYAHENLDGKMDNDYKRNFRPDGGKELKFDYPVNLKKEPKTYLKAAITNLFYWNNIMHDLFYKYGFDEVSGNFQQNNFDKGGKGNDAVIANAQDGAGYNNANFATPPDGQHGKMRMYVWSESKPNRDGDFESGIIIHEYAHGISTRLTGGPANSNCLASGEAGGMGEGWGDFFATVLRMRESYTRNMDFGMGVYAVGGKKEGIRKFLYSTDMSTNPSTYAFIKKFAYIGVHAKGEVWAAMLYELYWNLVDKHGFSKDLFNTKAVKEDGLPAGNVIALQLVVDGMKLQPCRPTFVDARDAILQADQANFNGSNVCEIWKAFAKRGLGLKAKSGGSEDFSLPVECQ